MSTNDSKHEKPCNIDIVKGSVLYSDYLKYGYLPAADTLLDWRNILVEKREDDVLNPPGWYNREIAAVDYLLSLHCP